MRRTFLILSLGFGVENAVELKTYQLVINSFIMFITIDYSNSFRCHSGKRYDYPWSKLNTDLPQNGDNHIAALFFVLVCSSKGLHNNNLKK